MFLRAFADAIQRAHKDFKNKHAVIRAIFLFTQHAYYLRYFSLLLNAVYLMAFVFYYRDMLEKVTTQRTQQFSPFSFLPKEPS